MDAKQIYYIPIYPDDDCCETLMHLFEGDPGLDDAILALLRKLDERESGGEGVDYIAEFERELGLRRISVRFIARKRTPLTPTVI
ncbi:hypothetical protein [Leptolyngbya sp. FACHB-261]|uniref:hypothetical protein n=1 Tax=Leptolyngbya sp. FACHB-261 TaxID=2692806 RepID=UPI00168A2903|nr:hypothetical protein [Leptolyngbya sp. FACHB-261]MBD2103412.1 hypothetical protein [Leptolyngbya sp. FACHB-261]